MPPMYQHQNLFQYKTYKFLRAIELLFTQSTAFNLVTVQPLIVTILWLGNQAHLKTCFFQPFLIHSYQSLKFWIPRPVHHQMTVFFHLILLLQDLLQIISRRVNPLWYREYSLPNHQYFDWGLDRLLVFLSPIPYILW